MSSQPRHVYTTEQRAILEASFIRQSHPNIIEKERLARLLNCNLIQISNWFQNHRRRVKNEKKKSIPTYPMMMPIYHQPDCPYTSQNQTSTSYYYQTPPSSYVYVPPGHPPQLFYTSAYDPYLTTYEQ